MKKAFLFFVLNSTSVFAQAGNAGNGYSNQSGKGNGENNFRDNKTFISVNHKCYYCVDTRQVTLKLVKPWHPPLKLKSTKTKS